MMGGIDIGSIIRQIPILSEITKQRTFSYRGYRYRAGRIETYTNTQNFTLQNIEQALNSLGNNPTNSLMNAVNSAIYDVLGNIDSIKNTINKQFTFGRPIFKYTSNDHTIHLTSTEQHNISLGNIQQGFQDIGSGMAGLMASVNQAIDDIINNRIPDITPISNQIASINQILNGGFTVKRMDFSYQGGNRPRIIPTSGDIQINLRSVNSGFNWITYGLNGLTGAINDAITDIIGRIPNIDALKNELNLSNPNSALSHFRNGASRFGALNTQFSTLNSDFSKLGDVWNTLQTQFSNLSTRMADVKSSFSSLRLDFVGLRNKFIGLMDAIPDHNTITGSYGTNIKKLKFNTKLDGSGTTLYFTIVCAELYNSDKPNVFSYPDVFDAIGKLVELAQSHIKYAIKHGPSGIEDDINCANEHLRYAVQLAIGVLGTVIPHVTTSSPIVEGIYTSHGLTSSNYGIGIRKLKHNQITTWATGYVVNPIYYALRLMKNAVKEAKGKLEDMLGLTSGTSDKFLAISNGFNDISTYLSTINNTLNKNKTIYKSKYDEITSTLGSIASTLSSIQSDFQNFISRMSNLSGLLGGGS